MFVSGLAWPVVPRNRIVWIICIIICISPVYLMQFGMINVFFQCAPGISSSTPTLTLLCTLPACPAFIVRCPKTSHLLKLPASSWPTHAVVGQRFLEFSLYGCKHCTHCTWSIGTKCRRSKQLHAITSLLYGHCILIDDQLGFWMWRGIVFLFCQTDVYIFGRFF